MFTPAITCRRKLLDCASWGNVRRCEDAFLNIKRSAPARIPSGSARLGARATYAKDSRGKQRESSKDEVPQKPMTDAPERQARTPWHRAGSDQAPVSRNESIADMTKGKLLSTPSRMLKVILPLKHQVEEKDKGLVDPLAFVVHPHQPLSYLERLIQSELPMIKDKDGKERVPAVHFRAEDRARDRYELRRDKDAEEFEESDNQLGKGQDPTTGVTPSEDDQILESTQESSSIDPNEISIREPGVGEEKSPGVAKGGPEPSGSSEPTFVRWSPSTEIGDFIRDAANGREFAIEIEGLPGEIRVQVPSFADRTFYLRMRLRKTSKKIASMADIKRECDAIAHRGARRVAMAGFGILCGWWYVVYRLTFETDLGWDVMEPVTYLVSLTALMGGYVWFLYHNREVSYRSAMNFTISRRQSALYNARGLDLGKWEALIEEGNTLRREIKAVAAEYDVEWDESKDALDERVMEELRRKRRKQKAKKDDDDDDD